MIPEPIIEKARATAEAALDAGLLIKEHVFVNYHGKLMHRLKVQRPDFGSGAACFGLDTNLFYPELTDDKAHQLRVVDPYVDESESIIGHTNYVMRVCEGCPFRDPCREWAVATGEHGVWGGTSQNDRKRIRFERRQMVAPLHFPMQDPVVHVLGRVA